MTTILSYLFNKLKEKGYELLKDFFFPKKTYIERLHKIIINTIQEFEKKYAIRENRNESFPFYHSRILYEKLIKYKLFKTNEVDFDKLLEEFKKNTNIHRTN